MDITFWGTRGSIPVPGKDTIKYGGNTPCIEIRTKENKLIILDAGSGLRELGKHLDSINNTDNFSLFFSHYHWDHIQGIPFFIPFYNPNITASLYGHGNYGENIQKILACQMDKKHFPIEMEDLKAKLIFNEITAGKIYNINGLDFETFEAKHSAPTLAYKINEDDKSIVYLTDNELTLDTTQDNHSMSEIAELNKDIIEFCRGCDYLIHDTMYDEASVHTKKGWGHSSNISLAYFSILAEVKNLVLFHYNPDHTDEKIDLLIDETSKVFSDQKFKIQCLGAKEGLKIQI